MGVIRILKWFVGVDLLLIIPSLFLERTEWLLNTQIAFFSSALVLGASMFSYSRMVYGRLATKTAMPEDERDTLEKIEDPYDLYSGETNEEEVQAPRETIREEKRRMKRHRRTLLQVLQDSRASLSFLRLGAYLLLFAGFFYLSKQQLLHIPSYLLGLALPILTILWLLMSQKEERDEAGL